MNTTHWLKPLLVETVIGWDIELVLALGLLGLWLQYLEQIFSVIVIRFNRAVEYSGTDLPSTEMIAIQ